MKENPNIPLHIDFLSPQMTYRRQHAGLRSELLARAIGTKPAENPYIVDATAGLGRDSFILASLGYHITLLERSTTVFQALQTALLAAEKALPDITQRMHLIHADAIHWLTQQPTLNHPDVIYLDPMFPARKKSASVKKEMLTLQNLLGKDQDCNQLLDTARRCAKKRVIVKRAKLAGNIGENSANFSLHGKSCRFDVYLSNF